MAKGGLSVVDMVTLGVAGVAVVGLVAMLSFGGGDGDRRPTHTASASSVRTHAGGGGSGSRSGGGGSGSGGSRVRYIEDLTDEAESESETDPDSESEGETRAMPGEDEEPTPPPDVGYLSESAVRNTIERYRTQLTFCYDFERAQAYDPSRVGELVIQAYVDRNGRVERGALLRDEFGADAACFNNVIRMMRFPAPAGGPVEVRFPVTLRARDR